MSNLYAKDLSFMTEEDWARRKRIDRITKKYDDWQAKLIEDFKAYTGGFHPSECDIDTVNRYIKYSMPSKAPDGAEKFLLEEHKR